MRKVGIDLDKVGIPTLRRYNSRIEPDTSWTISELQRFLLCCGQSKNNRRQVEKHHVKKEDAKKNDKILTN